MSANSSNIEKELTNAFLAAFPDAETLCAWPNRKFDTKGLAKWYQFFYLPSAPEAVSMGAQGMDGVEGVVQINLHIAPGKGDKVARDFGDTLRNAFTAGRHLRFTQGVVTIRNAGQKGPGRPEGEYFKTVFIIAWYARLQR